MTSEEPVAILADKLDDEGCPGHRDVAVDDTFDALGERLRIDLVILRTPDLDRGCVREARWDSTASESDHRERR